MKTHDVQSVSISRPPQVVFDFVADPANLPKWTHAFDRADVESADLATPAGAVAIKLRTLASSEQGTVDWEMIFPDGARAAAYSRVTPDGDGSVYSFVLLAPPVPLEDLEGALKEQMGTLSKELADLKQYLET
jgi:hypothetical protein